MAPLLRSMKIAPNGPSKGKEALSTDPVRQFCDYRSRRLENGEVFQYADLEIGDHARWEIDSSKSPTEKRHPDTIDHDSVKRQKISDDRPASIEICWTSIDEGLPASSLISTNKQLSTSSEDETTDSTSIASLTNDEDILSLKNFMSSSGHVSPSRQSENNCVLQLPTPPDSEAGFWSDSSVDSISSGASSVSIALGSNNTDVPSRSRHVSRVPSKEGPRTTSPCPRPDYGQSNNKFPEEYWFPTPDYPYRILSPPRVPSYKFIPAENAAVAVEEIVSGQNKPVDSQPEEISRVTSNPPTCIADGLAKRSITHLPRGNKDLLDIKLRPVKKGIHRAVPSKRLPPLYVPIMPPGLEWCLTGVAQPGDTWDDEDSSDEFIADEVAFSVARQVVGLRVLKRDVTRGQEQQRRKGRIVPDSCDDGLLHEYLLASKQPRKAERQVTFDDSVAQIVLAEWKGISVDELLASNSCMQVDD